MYNRARAGNSQLYETLKVLPKIELHRHLEGSLRLSTMAEIAQEYKLDLPGYDVDSFRHLVQIMPDDEPDSAVFLSKFNYLRHFYRSQSIIERIAAEAVEDAAADNIIYMELRFTPIALSRVEGHPLADATDWVIAAVHEASQRHGITVRLILSMNRHESVELGDEVVSIAIDRMGDGVVGVDLAGAEGKFPARPFAPVLHRAREAGLKLTVHAGEWAGADSIYDAIHVLGAARLGHGVRIIEDPGLMDVARKRGITLEVCPTSNVQSGVVADLSQHPLRSLYRAGLLTTLNTDDPSISGITLTDEYFVAVKHLGLSIDDVKQQAMNAARAAFLPDSEREMLVQRLAAGLALPL